MTFDKLERYLEAIQEAKREIILIEATSKNRTDLDGAYQGLVMAERSIERLCSHSRGSDLMSDS